MQEQRIAGLPCWENLTFCYGLEGAAATVWCEDRLSPVTLRGGVWRFSMTTAHLSRLVVHLRQHALAVVAASEAEGGYRCYVCYNRYGRTFRRYATLIIL